MLVYTLVATMLVNGYGHYETADEYREKARSAKEYLPGLRDLLAEHDRKAFNTAVDSKRSSVSEEATIVNLLERVEAAIERVEGGIHHMNHNGLPTWDVNSRYSFMNIHTLKIAVDAWFSDRVFATQTYGHISTWDTSAVTSMESLFKEKSSFNDDISAWDTSKVTSFENMFNAAKSFNGDLSNWDTSSATNMQAMFYGADNFKGGGVAKWDTSKVTNMDHMFAFAKKFNSDLSNWDTSSVTSMLFMFMNANSFNGNIGTWDVSSVEGMLNMFHGADNFNCDLSNWAPNAKTNFNGMFTNAKCFQGSLWSGSTTVDLSTAGTRKKCPPCK